MFRRGDIVRQQDKKEKGVVIDWGIFHQKYKKYVPAKSDMADCVRVWTEGRIEVWPVDNVLADNVLADSVNGL